MKAASHGVGWMNRSERAAAVQKGPCRVVSRSGAIRPAPASSPLRVGGIHRPSAPFYQLGRITDHGQGRGLAGRSGGSGRGDGDTVRPRGMARPTISQHEEGEMPRWEYARFIWGGEATRAARRV